MAFDFYSFYEMLTDSGARIRLDAGDPDHRPPREVLEILSREVTRELGYTPASGLRELREKIAELHGVDLGEVAVTPGAKAAVSALISRAGSIGVFAPHWPGYASAARFFGRAIVTEHLSPWRSWMPEYEDARSLASRVDALILNYPNNPTGAMIDRRAARKILEAAREEGGVVISDEAYRDLAFSGERLVMAEIESQGVVSVYSFSKTFAVPGLRIGYVIGDPELVRRVRDFTAATYTGVSRFAQMAAIKALELLDEAARAARSLYVSRLERVLSVIDGDTFEFIRPQGGLYMFLRLRMDVDGVLLSYRAAERGVGVFPGVAFGGEHYRNYIRISLTAPADVIIRGLEVVSEEARRLAGGRH